MRVRHGARAALILGVLVSIAANVLHAADNGISRIMSGWAPFALWIAIELIAKVPGSQRRWLKVARLCAATGIAGIAAWVSYWHMVGVAIRYGEVGSSPYLIPLTVDGLVVVAWICLVELSGRTAQPQQQGESDGQEHRQAAGGRDREVGGQHSEAEPGQPADAADRPGVGAEGSQDEVAAEPDKLSTGRKPHPSSAERVRRAHQRTPDAADDAIAKRLKLSAKTVKRHRPPPSVNGHVPDLEEVPT